MVVTISFRDPFIYATDSEPRSDPSASSHPIQVGGSTRFTTKLGIRRAHTKMTVLPTGRTLPTNSHQRERSLSSVTVKARPTLRTTGLRTLRSTTGILQQSWLATCVSTLTISMKTRCSDSRNSTLMSRHGATLETIEGLPQKGKEAPQHHRTSPGL